MPLVRRISITAIMTKTTTAMTDYRLLAAAAKAEIFV